MSALKYKPQGPSFTLLLATLIGSVMCGLWLAVVLGGIAGLK